MRKKRLDEHTAEMREQQDSVVRPMTQEQSQESAEKVALRRGLEDYDVTKELTGANKKRLKSGYFSLLTEDLAGFVSGISNLIPSPYGASIAAGINMAMGMAKLGKAAVVVGRQAGRNLGLKGFSKNKSTYNKMVRRHNLATTVFTRIKELNGWGLETRNPDESDPKELAFTKSGLAEYEKYDTWVEAMGISYGRLYHSKDAAEMVEHMRDGFYREK